MIVFGFLLNNPEVGAILIIIYEQSDLLFLTKSEFDKSLIFQLLLFMFSPQAVVIIFMFLKLHKEEEILMINCITSGNTIALTGNNNKQSMKCQIADNDFTNIFTYPKIILSKKFKNNLFNNLRFAKRLFLLATDKIHLVE